MDGINPEPNPAEPAQVDTNAAPASGVQNAPQSFIETLPEDLRGAEQLKSFDSAEKLARAHLETLGKLPVVPEKPEAYVIKGPEGHPINEQFVGAFKTWAHAQGLSQAQAQGLANNYIALEQSHMAEVAKQDAQAMDALKIEWGDKFDANSAIADKAILEFATEEEQKFLLGLGLTKAAPVVRMFHRIGIKMSDDSMPAGAKPSGGPSAMERTRGGMPQLDFPSMRKDK
jgi:hypothetical protein